MDIWSFLTLVILVFSIVMMIAGIFSAYFGAGKNRMYGGIIFAVGLVAGLVWSYLTIWSGISPFCDVEVWDVMYNALIDLIGVLIGALVAVGIFLVVVLKS
ncbi:MAG: hypothetical protein WCQ23_00725 [Candidatus Methanomethylophilaceae archaeon]|jgi:hypothetical protein